MTGLPARATSATSFLGRYAVGESESQSLAKHPSYIGGLCLRCPHSFRSECNTRIAQMVGLLASKDCAACSAIAFGFSGIRVFRQGPETLTPDLLSIEKRPIPGAKAHLSCLLGMPGLKPGPMSEVTGPGLSQRQLPHLLLIRAAKESKCDCPDAAWGLGEVSHAVRVYQPAEALG